MALSLTQLFLCNPVSTVQILSAIVLDEDFREAGELRFSNKVANALHVRSKLEGALKELEATLMAKNEEVEKPKEEAAGGFLEGFDNFREQTQANFF
ncbi:unnamed protein product [Ilex paraguariensis]|uniref:Uncharacterized protein n=1 Tax=Ilex paraguariensis TaxID=185542 RepID=A0ABC8RRF0_9AQUA